MENNTENINFKISVKIDATWWTNKWTNKRLYLVHVANHESKRSCPNELISRRQLFPIKTKIKPLGLVLPLSTEDQIPIPFFVCSQLLLSAGQILVLRILELKLGENSNTPPLAAARKHTKIKKSSGRKATGDWRARRGEVREGEVVIGSERETHRHCRPREAAELVLVLNHAIGLFLPLSFEGICERRAQSHEIS